MPPTVYLFRAAAVAALLAAAAPALAAQNFDPIAFFTGRTEGRGSLKIALSPHHATTVHGNGHVGGDGALVLDQTVIEGDKPPATRQWVIRATGPGRYAGTLSDASGPVAMTTDGDRLHIHFHMKGGIIADQQLTLGGDGEVAQNRMTFRKLGVVVGTLDETIRRVR